MNPKNFSSFYKFFYTTPHMPCSLTLKVSRMWCPPPKLDKYIPAAQFLPLLHSFSTLIGWICILISFQHPFKKIEGAESARLPSLLVPIASSGVEGSQIALRVGNSREGLTELTESCYIQSYGLSPESHMIKICQERKAQMAEPRKVSITKLPLSSACGEESHLCVISTWNTADRGSLSEPWCPKIFIGAVRSTAYMATSVCTTLEVRLRMHDLKSYLKPHC